MQGLMVEWEKNYAQLLILTEPKRNPTQITVIESAHSNNRQIRPRTQLNTVVAGLVGLIIALGLIFLMDFLDDTYKSVSDFSQSEEVNILGSIRKIKGRKLADKIVAHLHPHSPVAESYRIIRSRIRFKTVDKPTRSIMVTSSMPAEGKSVTVANLAVVFAQANYRTLIVDADLRHPALHDVFSVSNEVGLGDLLTSPELKVEDCIRNTSVNNLQILTSGMPLLDPSERLGSKRMEEILRELKNAAEIVIFDSPPVLVFADAIVLSRRTDGVIVVIQAGKTKRSAITQTFFDLQNANTNLLGSIFNQSPQRDTFSVNKAYMQERPQLPSSRTLERKVSTGGGRFHDLRDSATPLSGSLAVGSEEVSVDTTHAHNEPVEPEQKFEFVDLRDSATPLNESLELENEETIVEEAQIQDLIDGGESEHTDVIALHDSATPLTESVEENMETQFHDVAEEVESEHIVEVDDLSNSESDTTVQEFASPQTAKVNMSRRHRSRKNRKNGHGNEEIPDGQIRTSMDHENTYPKNGKTQDLTEKEANTPTDQGTVAVDQTEE